MERERAVKALLQLFQLGIGRLWDPPIVEEEFVKYLFLSSLIIFFFIKNVLAVNRVIFVSLVTNKRLQLYTVFTVDSVLCARLSGLAHLDIKGFINYALFDD